MEMEKRQADLIEQFTQQAAATTDPRVLASIIADATCHPFLFAFSEILSVPNIYKVL
jgi:COP9 signalosome complex subunit 7